MPLTETTTAELTTEADAGKATQAAPDARFHPPRVLPPPRDPGALEFLRLVIKDPLLAVPPEAYEADVLYRRWPARMAYACSPEAVRGVLVSQRAEFDRKPHVGRYILGPLLGRGILLAEGAHWKWQRQSTAPMFRHGEILGYVPVMERAARNTVDRWRASSETTFPIDADMIHATYEVIAKTVLIGGSEEITRVVEDEGQAYSRAFPWAVAYGILNMPDVVPRPGRRAMNRRDLRLRRIVDDMIEQAAMTDRPDDLLSQLRRARDPETGMAMSLELLIDNVLTFLLAGHHTTAMALTWTLYLLACLPDLQERLFEETMAIAPDAPVTADDVERFRAVPQAIKEAIRLFPPVPNMTRVAVEDTELAGQAIPAGTIINIPIYTLHRHARAWDDPHAFDADRFAPERERAHTSCQFLPFGAGPRICSGMAFALVEATVILATLVRSVRFELASPDFVPTPITRVILFPAEGMPLRVVPRNRTGG